VLEVISLVVVAVAVVVAAVAVVVVLNIAFSFAVVEDEDVTVVGDAVVSVDFDQLSPFDSLGSSFDGLLLVIVVVVPFVV
jgi:hypothetical protein